MPFRNGFELAFWSLVLLSALCLGSLVIRETFQSWHDHPVRTQLVNSPELSRRVQFPTVTVCAPRAHHLWAVEKMALNQFKNHECQGRCFNSETRELLGKRTAKLKPQAPSGSRQAA